jgi:hypothetical protein
MVSWLCPRRDISKRGDDTKMGQTWFFGTALLPNEIHLPIKVHVNIFYNYRVIPWTKFKV